MQIIDTIFILVVLIFSAIIHEVMHGVAAERLGDKTARYAGRITLNPLSHLDPVGSVLLPVILLLTHSPIFFAWAKPVPYNPYNLRPGRWSEAIVAGAGPLSNIVIALVFGILIRFGGLDPAVDSVLFLVVVMNVMLCTFNLFPIPPLDGSKVLMPLLPRGLAYQYGKFRASLEMNPMIAMMAILLFVIAFGSAYASFIYSLSGLIAGV